MLIPGFHEQAIREAVRQLVRRPRVVVGIERRAQERFEFKRPVKVVTEDNREFGLLCLDLSTTGIRILGTRGFLGHKVCVLIPRDDRPEPYRFMVRILWTCRVGDDLYENGGAFLEVDSRSPT